MWLKGFVAHLKFEVFILYTFHIAANSGLCDHSFPKMEPVEGGCLASIV